MHTFEEISTTAMSIINTGEANGIYYSNSLLEAEGYTDAPDPATNTSKLTAATLLWQHNGQKYIESAFDMPGGMTESQVASYYDLLSNSRVSQVAMDRIPEHIQAHWRTMQEQVKPVPLFVHASCMTELLGAPVGLITRHIVKESEHLSAGDRFLNLYYPYFIGPRMVLAGMKQVIKNKDSDRRVTFGVREA